MNPTDQSLSILSILMHGILSLRRTFHKYYTNRRIEATYQVRHRLTWLRCFSSNPCLPFRRRGGFGHLLLFKLFPCCPSLLQPQSPAYIKWDEVRGSLHDAKTSTSKTRQTFSLLALFSPYHILLKENAAAPSLKVDRWLSPFDRTIRHIVQSRYTWKLQDVLKWLHFWIVVNKQEPFIPPTQPWRK